MKKIEFLGSLGNKLSARLDEPNENPKAFALFAHCFTCTKDILAASYIAQTLTKHGIAVLRFDFTGLGGSGGDFENTNFSSNIQDLIKAADYLRDNFEAPKLLIGHSLGGTATLASAQSIPESRAVVTIGSPADAAHIAHHFTDVREQIINEGEAEVLLEGRPFKIKKQFVEDIENYSIENRMKGMNKALLIMHAPTDKTVGIENATKIFSWAKHPKSFISLDQANHLLTEKRDSSYAANIIAAWSSSYID